jgi:hypothetical protein
MTFTLKNRPKTCFKESSFTKWFEGFEKQETKRLSDAEFAQMDLETTEKTMKRRAYYEGYIKAKEEILGQ